MRRRICLLLSVTLFGCCSTSSDSVETPTTKIALHCLILDLDSDCGKNFRLNDDDGPPVLSDIETFFLFHFQGGIKSEPIHFDAGETIRLSHTSQHPTSQHHAKNGWVSVSADVIDDNVQLHVISSEESPVDLERDVEVVLPKDSSTIFATLNRAPEDGLTFVWIINATSTKQ